MLDMVLNSTYGSVSQKIIKGAFRSGILFLRPPSILKSNVDFLSKLSPSAGRPKAKQNDQMSPVNKENNVKEMRTRKTYVMHDLKAEAKQKANSNRNAKNALNDVPQNRVTLNAGSVYQFMQERKNPVSHRNLTQRKHWVLETQSPAYRVDLMYKKLERGRDTKLLNDIKLIYLKRMENIQNLMNKPEEKPALTHKMCNTTTLISKVKNFHTHASTYKKRDDEPPGLQSVSDSIRGTKPAAEEPSAPPAESPTAIPPETPTVNPIEEPPTVTPTSSTSPEAPPVGGTPKPPTVTSTSATSPEAPSASPEMETNLEFPKVLSDQPKRLVELEVSSTAGLHPDIPIAQHCSHRVTHVIQHVDSVTKEKAYVKKTEEIFDLQDVEGMIPVHIESVEKPLVLGHATKMKEVKLKEFDRRGKLHPESLEYMWIEILLPKILKHIEYLDENREDARIVSNNVSVNSLDFIKKDPRTKFSGFPQEPGKKNIDVQSQD